MQNRFVGLGLLSAIVFMAAACGGSESATPTTSTTIEGLSGFERETPLVVGGIEASRADGSGTTPLRADPGELLVVYFGYANCPDICPTTMADLRIALRELGEDASRVDVAMFTVDPERDTEAVLADFLGFFFADGQWTALRPADQAELEAVTGAFGVKYEYAPPDPDGTYEVGHTALSFVVDETGLVIVEWPFGFEPDRMASDLRYLFETRIPSPEEDSQ